MYNHYISPTDAAMAGNHIKFNRISTPAYAGSILDIAMDKIDKITNNFTGNQFKSDFDQFIRPTLKPYYSLSPRKLHPKIYYSIDEILNNIQSFKSSHPNDPSSALISFALIIHNLKDAQQKGLTAKNPNIRHYYQDNNVIENILFTRCLNGYDLPKDQNLFEFDFNNFINYTDNNTVITNITEANPNKDKSIQDLMTIHNVNSEIILAFIHMFGLYHKDFTIMNDKLYLTPEFQNKLNLYLR